MSSDITTEGVDVTAVIPTFRRPERLGQAIESVLAQRGISIEIVVVDDSPEGSAREVVKSFDPRRVAYRKRPTPSNGRPALARNDAWPLARGRYVNFLDDDDTLAPGAYLAHVEGLDANLKCGMSFGRVEPFGADTEAVRREAIFWQGAAERARRATRLGRFGLVATMLFEHAVLQSSACMVRKSTLREIGGFDPLMPLQEDTEMAARVARLRGSIFVDRPVVRYHVGATSLMRAGDTRALLDLSYARMRRKYRERHGMTEYMALKLGVMGARALGAASRQALGGG